MARKWRQTNRANENKIKSATSNDTNEDESAWEIDENDYTKHSLLYDYCKCWCLGRTRSYELEKANNNYVGSVTSIVVRQHCVSAYLLTIVIVRTTAVVKMMLQMIDIDVVVTAWRVVIQVMQIVWYAARANTVSDVQDLWLPLEIVCYRVCVLL